MVEKNNNVIIFDGVQYKISPADWKQLQTILSRATVLNIAPEKLTDAVVERLVGHKNVVYYNCETNAWNTNKYNGYTINGQDADTNRVREFKFVMEKEAEFSKQYEFAASITMTTDRMSFSCWGKLIGNPQYTQRGVGVVGNIIVKNKATGKYELYCKSWVGVYAYRYPEEAVSGGANWFANYGARDSSFRSVLMLAHTR